MMPNKKNEITKLLTSSAPELINSRFLVKASLMNNGVNDISIMLIITDLAESAFTIKYFKKQEDATMLLKLLKTASS